MTYVYDYVLSPSPLIAYRLLATSLTFASSAFSGLRTFLHGLPDLSVTVLSVLQEKERSLLHFHSFDNPVSFSLIHYVLVSQSIH